MHGVHVHEILLLPHPALVEVEAIGARPAHLDGPLRRRQLGSREIDQLSNVGTGRKTFVISLPNVGIPCVAHALDMVDAILRGMLRS